MQANYWCPVRGVFTERSLSNYWKIQPNLQLKIVALCWGSCNIMLMGYWVCKVQTHQLLWVQSGRGCAETGHRDGQQGFISSCRRCKLLPNPTAKSCSSLHMENWQMRFPLTSEPTESGSNIASVCYPGSFISFQLIKLCCGSPAHRPLSWSRTRCSFSFFAIRPLGTSMKAGKSRQRTWNRKTVLSDTEDKRILGEKMQLMSMMQMQR